MTIQHLHIEAGRTLAYDRLHGRGPTLLWLGGFKSDMTGSKAEAMMAWARQNGQAAVRFDYSGHGQSSGAFIDGRIGHWRADSLAVLDHLTDGPVIAVGSSMGGWMAAHLALNRPDRIAGLALIAPAPDFVSALMIPALPDAAKAALRDHGVWFRPSDYDPQGYPISQDFLNEAPQWDVLGGPRIAVPGPVRILHGMDDRDVPWMHGVRMAQHIDSPDLTVTLVAGGDHRLSTPDDLTRLRCVLTEVAA